MGIFGNKARREAEQAAATAEVERLIALSPTELAGELMPAFGPDGAPGKGRQGVPPLQIVTWLLRSSGRNGADLRALVPAVLAGLETLRSVGLVTQTTSGTNGQRWSPTPLGETALADGTFRALVGAAGRG
ncbi:MAG TPA: hypothetical protein VGM91_02125 [Conexibacter sp.]|jgi:hypothetical protein